MVVIAVFWTVVVACWLFVGWLTAVIWTVAARRRYRWAPRFEPGPFAYTMCTAGGVLAGWAFLVVCAGLTLARAGYWLAARLEERP